MLRLFGFASLLLLSVACVDASRDRDTGGTPSCAKRCGSECCNSQQACDQEMKTCVACEPKSCDTLGINCGTADDGCGGKINCGGCNAPETCGGGGTPNVCGMGACQPKTCEQLGKNCGSVADGCGGTLSCGTCPEGQRCGGGGANICGTGECTPETDRQFCERLGKNCGSVTDFDNCDTSRTVASCGNCTSPQTCGGGGNANICGCTGETPEQLCAAAGKNCGNVTVRDSCGVSRTVSCGGCNAPETCGGGGTPNVCACGAETDQQFCARFGKNCGPVSNTDNCGQLRTANCGSCTAPSTCQSDNTCYCTESDQEFCTRLGKDCNSVTAQDVCGNARTVNCGACNAPDQCLSNVCTCIESQQDFCTRLGKNCGSVTALDRCGNLKTFDCGSTCATGSCGGGGTANVCGGFVTMSSPTSLDLNGVWTPGTARAWAVGNSGTMVFWDGSSWAAETRRPTITNALYDVFGVSSTSAWAVGYNGTKLRWDGTSWTAQPDGDTNLLYSLWGSGNTYWMTGSSSHTYKNQSNTGWSLVKSTGPQVFDISADSSGTMWGCSNTQGVVKWSGSSWVQSTPTTVSLYATAVWTSGPNDVWASGQEPSGLNAGQLWHYNGSQWSQVTSPTTAGIQSMWGSGPNDVWAVGSYGTLLHYDGSNWVSLPSGTTHTLNAIRGTGPTGDVWAVGTFGTILRLAR